MIFKVSFLKTNVFYIIDFFSPHILYKKKTSLSINMVKVIFCQLAVRQISQSCKAPP